MKFDWIKKSKYPTFQRKYIENVHLFQESVKRVQLKRKDFASIAHRAKRRLTQVTFPKFSY